MGSASALPKNVQLPGKSIEVKRDFFKREGLPEKRKVSGLFGALAQVESQA